MQYAVAARVIPATVLESSAGQSPGGANLVLLECEEIHMLKKSLVAIALSAVMAVAVGAESDARNAAKQTIELQDGSILYVFQNGKMAVENRFGIATSTRPGTELRAKDGSSITMVGNEVGYLDSFLKERLGE